MVIPNQPPLTATKKSATPKPGIQPIPVTPVGPLKPQPVPASYTTAATPTRPPFNVQVKSAHPAPHFPPSPPQYGGLAPQPASSIGPYAPAQPRAPDYGYVPPPVGYGSAPPPSRQPEPAYAGSASLRGWDGAEPSYGPPSAWKPEPAYPPAVGQYPSSGARKSHGFEPAPASQPPALQPKIENAGPSAGPAFRPEDELEHLTKKMLYDMDNPPSEEYFGRCARCGENVVGEGTGCTAMDQVFHVDCFTCMICHNKLRGQPFYAVEKKAYCEPCYIVSKPRSPPCQARRASDGLQTCRTSADASGAPL
ncbi:lipoma-preferred partner homolog [Crotalus tigris]|uniref:lipoma-preferred partner homolog n=1 Tax=Crotalus tigris TaxID=88082 RepID=UPI00192F599D|nr:lipoma-preferred partner homolog [Crotalus tigris]